jgi:hypothetical protein
MPWWMLLLFLTFTWFVWVVGGALAARLAIVEGRLAPNAGFCPAPVFPVFPLLFFGVAKLVDLLLPPWGTNVVGMLHGGLLVLFIILILRDILRGSLSTLK